MSELAINFINDHIKSTKERISVNPGKGMFNNRCHMNSVHEAINHNEDTIAMMMCIGEDETFIHFCNINSEGEYFDNTLGNWNTKYEYYLIKRVHKCDFFNIISIFTSYRKELKNILPWYIRWFNNYSF